MATLTAQGGKAPRVATVDGLRGLAALIVVFDHVVGPAWGLGSWTEQNHGISVFAMLTGFLISAPFLRDRLEGRRPQRVAPFLRARAARVFPGYWVALAVAAATVGLTAVDDPLDLPQVITLTQTIGTDTPFEGLSPAWSLSVFLSFYLTLPLWTRWRRRSRADARGGVRLLRAEALCLGVIVVLAWVVRTTSLTDGFAQEPVFTILGRADWFAAGMILAVMVAGRAQGVDRPLLTLLGRVPGWAWLGALAATVASARIPLEHEEIRDQMDSLAAVLLVGGAVLHGATLRGPQRVLASRPARALGRWSFGIFLWGYIAQKAVVQLWPEVATGPHLALTMLAAILCGAASWRWVEQPAMRRFKRPRDAPMSTADPAEVTALAQRPAAAGG